MSRTEILNQLSSRKAELRRQFGVRDLALFGSTARDEAREDSDVDVLVRFEAEETFDGYMGLLLYLQDLFGRKVDLVIEHTLKPKLRPYVERDAIYVP